MAQKTGLRSVLLERRLEAMGEQLEMKDAQLAEVLTAANLDPATLQASWRGGEDCSDSITSSDADGI